MRMWQNAEIAIIKKTYSLRIQIVRAVMAPTLGLDWMEEIRRVVRDKNTMDSTLHLAAMLFVSIRKQTQEARTHSELGRK